jgi:hypothetical protein
MGMEVVPMLMRSNADLMPGQIAPRATPVAMARKIHKVRKRSRNEILRRTEALAMVMVG